MYNVEGEKNYFYWTVADQSLAIRKNIMTLDT